MIQVNSATVNSARTLVNSARNSGDFGPEHNGLSDFGPIDCVPSKCGLMFVYCE